MNFDRTPKTNSVWPTLRVKIASLKSGREWAFSSQLSLTGHGMLQCLFILLIFLQALIVAYFVIILSRIRLSYVQRIGSIPCFRLQQSVRKKWDSEWRHYLDVGGAAAYVQQLTTESGRDQRRRSRTCPLRPYMRPNKISLSIGQRAPKIEFPGVGELQNWCHCERCAHDAMANRRTNDALV